MNSIHDNFVVSVQCMESRYKVFEVMGEWIAHLKEAMYEPLQLKELEMRPDVLDEVRSFLEMEQDTWSLILDLCYFRLETSEQEGSDDDIEVDTKDEMSIINRITSKDRTVREMAIMLGWLESNFSKQPPPDLINKFINWEQTLESLKRESKLDFKGSRPMVTRIDPDVCFREGKEIHPIDSEDDMKVMKGAFYYIRSGQYTKTVEHLFESGHISTAAMLNGAMYSEKVAPNMANTQGTFLNTYYGDGMYLGGGEGDATNNVVSKMAPDLKKFATVGNSDRDIWKCTAFEICEANGLSKYGRATLATVCGHRKSLLNVAVTWEDKLWSYLRTLYDVRVEGEFRRYSTAELVALPDEYWAQETTLLECMNEVMPNDTGFVGNLKQVFQLVQKYFIIDDTDVLLSKLKTGLSQLLTYDGDDTVLTGHLLRFLTHLLLAMGVIGLSYEEDLMNTCTEAYIKVLIREGKLAFIPFYVEKLSAERQIPVIVEQIHAYSETKRDVIELFMQAAYVNNLNVLGIGTAIVEKLCDSQDDFDVESLHWITSCYSLVHDPREVMLAFLQNSIAIIRKFLTLNDLAKCNQVMRQVDDSCIEEVLSLSEDYDFTLVRECFCYKTYLEAEDSLLLWQRSLRQKPQADAGEQPRSLQRGDLSVAEQALLEKKNSDAKAAELKWKKAMNHHLKNCIQKFFAVLTFNQGWLVDCVTPTNETEFNRVKAIRRLILPKVVFVLIKLITEQNSLASMRQLVYILCEDSREILNEFTTGEISSIFKAVEEFVRNTSTTLTELPK